MYNAKEKSLKIGNTTMDYITFGTGGKNLVMIQGLNTRGVKGMATPLAFMYRIFAKDFTVYLFDRKNDIPKDYTVKDIADDIAFAMNSLSIKNADILGVSQGGMITQYLAINYPEMVNKLALCFTLSRNNLVVENVIDNWIDMTVKGKFGILIRDMAEKMYSDKYLKLYRPFLPLLTVLQKPKDTERFCTLAKACLTCDTYHMLNKITCPVFVVGAEKDKIVTADASLEIAEKLKCKMHIYPNLGHAAYEEARDFNKRIYNFFKE